MRIEAYLFIPFRGQYRFSFEVRDQGEGRKFKYGGIAESKLPFDYFWDIGMRKRPTLHELIDPESRLILTGWKDAIYTAFNRIEDKMVNSNNSKMKQQIADGYVEFVRVT